MRALFSSQRVSPAEMVPRDVPMPEPRTGEVRIRLHAAALNHTDLRIVDRDSEPPQIPGADGSGVIEMLGEGVAGIAVGAEVVIWPSMDWGEREDTFGPKFSILGYQSPGTYADYIAVPAQNVYRKPLHLSHQEAAALPLAAMTAYRALFPRARLAPGETVLIHGIGGGVAIFALQMASLLGARVMVTSTQDWKLERARSLGAEVAVNSRSEDWVARALDWTGDKGVDLVVESLGGDYLAKSLEAVRWGGRIVTFGRTVSKTAEIDLFKLFWHHVTLLGSTMGSASDFAGMLDFVNKYRLRPVIDTVYPLKQIGGAFARLLNAEQFGKVVLQIS